jgi:hypothetical protein
VIKGSKDFIIKDMFLHSELEKGLIRMKATIQNKFGFDIPDCKLHVLLAPAGLKKKDKGSNKKLEKYSAAIGTLKSGDEEYSYVFKGKNNGNFRIKKIMLKIAKYKFKIPLPEALKNKELPIQEENKNYFLIKYYVLDHLSTSHGRLPTDNTIPFLLSFSEFSFKMDRIHIEISLKSQFSVKSLRNIIKYRKSKNLQSSYF